ncbi:MAG: helix-turn-helix transcriptional regulator [Hyphomicrobiales bacterium]|nr:helix-turn-helix transcriptional regulator [Hyphomicrobiales bacterium]
MSRLRRDDWLDLALAALAEDGPDGLTLEALCDRAGRTRGSFYHHFADHEAFVSALVDRWTADNTERLVAAAEAPADAKAGLDALNDLTSVLDPRLEVGMRRLAARQPAVRRRVARVDARRMEVLARLYGAYAALPPAPARTLAELIYTAYLGAMHVWPEAEPKRYWQHGRAFSRLLDDALPNLRRRARKGSPST